MLQKYLDYCLGAASAPHQNDELLCPFLQADKASFVEVKMSVQKRIRRYNSAMSRMRLWFLSCFVGLVATKKSWYWRKQA
jgi:hypothetical protein